MWSQCIVILLLILLNAFFALSEMAIVSASKPLLRQWAQEGNRRAKITLHLAENPGIFLSTVQVGITLIGILAGVYGGATIAKEFEHLLSHIDFIQPYAETIAVFLVVGTITYLSVVIGELLPKQIALKYSEKIAMMVTYPMACVSWVCKPIVVFLESSARFLMRLVGILGSDEAPITQAEIRAVIAEGLSSGVFGHDENQMLHSVMDLTDITVEKVMTHRKNIEMLGSNLPIDEMIDKALLSPYTRIPLFQDQPENIVGVLHSHLLARQLHRARAENVAIDLNASISEPWFVPETTTLLEQLQAFRERKEQFALVVDEYGVLLGLITREDILEEIVGDMDGDMGLMPLSAASNHPGKPVSIIVDGRTTIRELNREYDWNLPDDEYATVAGLVLYEARALPEVGQSFTFYHFRFDILERRRNQITSVRVTKLETESPPR